MKTKKLLTQMLFFLLVTNLFSQHKEDSLNYYISIVEKPKNRLDLVNAYKFFKEEKEKHTAQKYQLGIVYDVLQIATIQDNLGQYYDSETSAIEGIKYLDSIPASKITISYKIYLLNRLGIVRRKLIDYSQSLKHYSRVLKLTQNKGDSIIAYNNIGVTYKYLGKNIEAKEVLEKAYNLSNVTKDKYKIALTLSNLGYIKAILNENDGEEYMKKSIDIRTRIRDPKLYESYKNIVEYYKFKDTVKAKIFGEKAYKLAKESKNHIYLEDALSNLVDLNLHKYFKEYKHANDSIKLSGLLSDDKYASHKYNYVKVEIEKEREKSKRIEKEKESIRNLLIAGIILSGAIFLYFSLKNRHKKEKLKTRFETERIISKKLHDEVANDVYSMMSKLENDPNTEKELIDNLEEVYLKTRDISKTYAAIDVSEGFDELLIDLIMSYKTVDVNIFTRNISQISWDSIANLKKETLYRVIQELMTNMKKHSQATLVTVQFIERKNKVSVIYRDNGIGCVLKYGNGLRNTENRIKMANCRITFESGINEGFHAKLMI